MGTASAIPRLGLRSVATLALALAACSGASPPANPSAGMTSGTGSEPIVT